jgi:aminoglycoside/choline kinase family phosphotransferase
MSDFAAPEIQNFLARAGWSGAVVGPLPGDASTRRYARVSKDGERLMLMHQPQGAETAAAPASATAAQRQALGYNAVARLAGADTGRFAAVADYLRGRGLAAPRIHAADFSQGLVLLEDFGDALFADVLKEGGPEEELYRHAVEVLARLHAEEGPAQIGDYPLFAYDELALLAETDLLTEWFMPLALGRAVSEEERASHRALWKKALDQIAGAPKVFVHRDYHAQNLIWMPSRAGLEKVGLIDFQDAVAGPRAYDLVSLLEDARRDVAPELAARATAHYLATMRAQGTPVDEEAFRAEMAVMAAQRNAKIVGIFARLYRRDGKARYLAYLPRVWRMLEADLRHPSLAELRAWYDQAIPPAARTLPDLQKDSP